MSADLPALSVVIPVFNEGENITSTVMAVLEKVCVSPLEILVVHDFPEDTTVPVVEALQGRHPQLRLHLNTLGRGAINAIKAGLAASRAPHVLVTMADQSDDPGSIDAMYALAVAGADVVSGSRYMRGGHQYGGPIIKRTLSRVAGLTLHWVGGLPTHDPTNSFRIYSRGLLEAVRVESDGGFELGLELTVKAHRLGMKVAEVPTTWRDRTAGESRFQTRKWLPKYLRWYRMGIVSRLITIPRT
ncbi:MAG: glycosyltransferase [Candidatus Dormibacteria bacterium]